MTPEQLLALDPIKVLKCDGIHNQDVFSYMKGSSFDHLPEVCPSNFGEDYIWYEALANMTNRLMVKVYLDPYIDGYRTDVVAVVYYTHIPVMIIKHGGRASKDWQNRWILDDIQFTNMTKHLTELSSQLNDETVDVVLPTTDIPELTL